MKYITANELKTKGISVFKNVTDGESEGIITVRGERRYVVLPIESYNYLRECELEVALWEAKQDLKKGNYSRESVKSHIKKLKRG